MKENIFFYELSRFLNMLI